MFMYAGAQQVNRFSFLESDIGTAVLDGHPDYIAVDRGVRVFRVGTFTDMFGRTKTWTEDMLDEAVSHFRTLRDRNIVPHVPIRRDHTISIKDVGGYIMDVRREGTFLLADLGFTDEDMYSKYKNKTYRNRSLEIGQYVTNDGEMYDPVVLGLAFVDLPAVEGLYHLSTGENMGTRTPPASHSQGDPTQTDPPAGDPPAGDPPATDPPATDPPAADPPAADPPAADPPAADPPAADPPAQHGRASVHAFRVNGATVYDYSAVQAHIDTLEGFQTDTIATARRDFVDGLAEARIITNPQKSSFHALVQTMTPEQFEAFKGGFDAAPANSIFGRHPGGEGDDNGNRGPAETRADRIEVLERIVHNHRRVHGMSEEKIEQTDSWRELQALKAQG